MDVKLNVDEQDALDELIASDGWKPLIKLIEHYNRRIQQKVLVYNLLDGTDGLVHSKARAEGSQELLTAIKSTRAKPKNRDR